MASTVINQSAVSSFESLMEETSSATPTTTPFTRNWVDYAADRVAPMETKSRFQIRSKKEISTVFQLQHGHGDEIQRFWASSKVIDPCTGRAFVYSLIEAVGFEPGCRIFERGQAGWVEPTAEQMQQVETEGYCEQ